MNNTRVILRGWGLLAAGLVASLVLSMFTLTAYSADETPPADPAAPEVDHIPVTSVLRGQPVNITAVIKAAAGFELASQKVLVRLTDAGTPIETAMSEEQGEADTYTSVLPVSMIKSVNVFWYAIDVRDNAEHIGGTPWYRVVIIEPIDAGGGAAGDKEAAAAGAAAGGGGGGAGETAAIVAGGLLLAGGAIVVIEDDDDGDGDNDDPPPAPPEEGGGGGGDDDDDSDDEEDDVSPPPPCVTTGSETVTYENLSYYCGRKSDDILILVCGTCPLATISASGSWGAEDSISMYDNPTCSPTGPQLVLTMPESFSRAFRPAKGVNGFINPGDYTITVYANGVQIDQIPWPPLSDQDCL